VEAELSEEHTDTQDERLEPEAVEALEIRRDRETVVAVDSELLDEAVETLEMRRDADPLDEVLETVEMRRGVGDEGVNGLVHDCSDS